MECQNAEHKRGVIDDGLLGGGKNASGGYEKWRWTHDNCYAYWALKAAENWAHDVDDMSFAQECNISAKNILMGIDRYLYDSRNHTWHIAIDENNAPRNEGSPCWIQYSPLMLDLPVGGSDEVNSSATYDWMRTELSNGSCICCLGDLDYKDRMYPGLAFQAALTFFNSENETHKEYARSAIDWAENSGLWQKQPDENNVTGGWVDWMDETDTDEEWRRFIDTSFYSIASWNGGYDFRIP